ncbi:uncharacterized protein LOC109598557 [Aethina tumida]|uniref:uncharacterized protein LOC109598557 n=1 Tax=Aethina tumida TaxID=116153 RepID=UPI0021495FE8|nr:uncharacterized protein LOC109598557 [Aethina tumida]
MVRTGDGGVRISGGKSSKKGGGGSRSSGTPSKRTGGGDGRLHAGVLRETPQWQKPITNFFNMPQKPMNEVSEQDKTENEVDEVPDVGAEEDIISENSENNQE